MSDLNRGEWAVVNNGEKEMEAVVALRQMLEVARRQYLTPEVDSVIRVLEGLLSANAIDPQALETILPNNQQVDRSKEAASNFTQLRARLYSSTANLFLAVSMLINSAEKSSDSPQGVLYRALFELAKTENLPQEVDQLPAFITVLENISNLMEAVGLTGESWEGAKATFQEISILLTNFSTSSESAK